MSASYLIRFDDICETMNWYVWERVERALRKSDVRPVLAVVPDNQDPDLKVSDPHPLFWERVQEWASHGYTIGIHGYQHRFETEDPGILRLHRRSEFAGLSYEQQREKLKLGRAVFAEHKISPDLFVAPAHSFDQNTLRALRSLGINSISDGYFPFPRKDQNGMKWLPQQIWHFRPIPFGVWTVCLHINRWTDADIEKFERTLEEYLPWISDPKRVLAELDYSPRAWTSFIFPEQYYAPVYRKAIELKSRLSRAQIS